MAGHAMPLVRAADPPRRPQAVHRLQARGRRRLAESHADSRIASPGNLKTQVRRHGRCDCRDAPNRGSRAVMWQTLPTPEEEQPTSGRYAAVPVKRTRVVPCKGNCFQHRVDAELGHEISHVGADGIHGEVQLFRHSVTVRGSLR